MRLIGVGYRQVARCPALKTTSAVGAARAARERVPRRRSGGRLPGRAGPGNKCPELHSNTAARGAVLAGALGLHQEQWGKRDCRVAVREPVREPGGPKRSPPPPHAAGTALGWFSTLGRRPCRLVPVSLGGAGGLGSRGAPPLSTPAVCPCGCSGGGESCPLGSLGPCQRC